MDSADVIERRKLELIEQLDDSRNSMLGSFILIDEQLENKRRYFKECAQFPQKIAKLLPKGSYQKLSIAAISGIFLSKLMSRNRNKLSKSASRNSSLFKTLTLLLLKPLLQKVLLEQSRSWISRYMDKRVDSTPPQSTRPLG